MNMSQESKWLSSEYDEENIPFIEVPSGLAGVSLQFCYHSN